jgi:hypothetical protein
MDVLREDLPYAKRALFLVDVEILSVEAALECAAGGNPR